MSLLSVNKIIYVTDLTAVVINCARLLYHPMETLNPCFNLLECTLSRCWSLWVSLPSPIQQALKTTPPKVLTEPSHWYRRPSPAPPNDQQPVWTCRKQAYDVLSLWCIAFLCQFVTAPCRCLSCYSSSGHAAQLLSYLFCILEIVVQSHYNP